ncbi:hypothetical protein [Verrucomicrobium spinosum]|uniref:hypothetical protein n=1 Tax=Verrucomicrobium spinosum TaxID=2736 RepID=UPI0001744E52|nr:hypothetical protein [Verrucomicrobium spinosum]
MKSRSLPAAIVMVSVMLMLALWVGWRHRVEEGPIRKPSPPVSPALTTSVKPSSPGLRDGLESAGSGFDWSSLSDEELRAYSRTFRTEAAGRSYNMDRKVISGEPVVADVFEAAPGEFVFTRLTPTISSDAEGRPFVKVQVESFSVGGPDGVRDRIVRAKDVYPSATQIIGVAYDSGTYSVAVGAEIRSEHEVQLRSSGSYQQAVPVAKTE